MCISILFTIVKDISNLESDGHGSFPRFLVIDLVIKPPLRIRKLCKYTLKISKALMQCVHLVSTRFTEQNIFFCGTQKYTFDLNFNKLLFLMDTDKSDIILFSS